MPNIRSEIPHLAVFSQDHQGSYEHVVGLTSPRIVSTSLGWRFQTFIILRSSVANVLAELHQQGENDWNASHLFWENLQNDERTIPWRAGNLV